MCVCVCVGAGARAVVLYQFDLVFCVSLFHLYRYCTYLSVFMICLSACLPVYLCVCVCVCAHECVCVRECVCVSVCVCVCVRACVTQTNPPGEVGFSWETWWEGSRTAHTRSLPPRSSSPRLLLDDIFFFVCSRGRGSKSRLHLGKTQRPCETLFSARPLKPPPPHTHTHLGNSTLLPRNTETVTI